MIVLDQLRRGQARRVGAVVVGNVLPSQSSSAYPAGNFFPSSATSVLFSNLAGGDFSLLSSNSYYTSTLGLVGVNTSSLNAKISGVAW